MSTRRRGAWKKDAGDYVFLAPFLVFFTVFAVIPLVFGLAGGATVLPIAVDRYAQVRMEGAFRTWGISGQVVPLAALITGLSVGNATQFDQARIWYFDSSAEGWTGAPSGPVAVAGGLIRPANGAGGYIVSPDGLAVDAARYSQVRLRVERTGTPAWTGYLWWAGASEGWSTARRVAIALGLLAIFAVLLWHWAGSEGSLASALMA